MSDLPSQPPQQDPTPAKAQSDPTPPAPRVPLWRRLLWPDWTWRKRMFRVEAWVVVIGAYALLALAYLLPQDYRNESPGYVLLAWAAFMVRVFQFHLGLLLLVIAVVAAFVRGKRLFLWATPLVLFTLAPVLWTYLSRPARTPAPQGGTTPRLRVMSCNLLTVNRDFDGILAEIRAADPDILLLQEYSNPWHEAAHPTLRSAYPHFSFVTRDDAFGVAMYSKSPFVEHPDNRVPIGRVFVEQTRAVVRFGGRDVAVYNIHLLPPRRLNYTLEGRVQFADLLKNLSEEKLPYAMGGDFNLTNDTPQHRDLRRIGARDVHDVVGQGRGATWPVNSFFRYVPGLRLDHVYVGPGLTPVRAETGVGRGSDHRPVITELQWAASPPTSPQK
jgi:endonuclease/exonuclease/phosphatase (EEP) superfamily protein YafD